MEKIIKICIIFCLLYSSLFVSIISSQPAPTDDVSPLLKKADTFYNSNDYKHAYEFYVRARDERYWYDGISLYRLAYSEANISGESPSVFYDYASAYAVLSIEYPKNKYIESSKKKLLSFKSFKNLGKSLVTIIDKAAAVDGFEREKSFALFEYLMDIEWKDDFGKVTSFKPLGSLHNRPGDFDSDDNDIYINKFAQPLYFVCDQMQGDTTIPVENQNRIIEAAIRNDHPSWLYRELINYPDNIFPPLELAKDLITFSVDKLTKFTDKRMSVTQSFNKIDHIAINYYRDLPEETIKNYINLRDTYFKYQEGFVQADSSDSLGLNNVEGFTNDFKELRRKELMLINFINRGVIKDTEKQSEIINNDFNYKLEIQAKIKNFIIAKNENNVIEKKVNDLISIQIESIKNIYSIEKDSASNNIKIEPWESKKEYEDRVSKIINSILDGEKYDIENITNLFENSSKELKASIQKGLENFRNAIEQYYEIVDYPQLSVKVGNFNRDLKEWPIHIESISNDIKYEMNTSISIADSNDLSSDFDRINKSINSGSLKAKAIRAFNWLGDSNYIAEMIIGIEIYDKENDCVFQRNIARKEIKVYEENNIYKALSDNDIAKIEEISNKPILLFTGEATAIGLSRLDSNSFTIMMSRNNNTEVSIVSDNGSRSGLTLLNNYLPNNTPNLIDISQYKPNRYIFTSTRAEVKNESGGYWGIVNLEINGSIQYNITKDLLRFYSTSCYDSSMVNSGRNDFLFIASRGSEYTLECTVFRFVNNNIYTIDQKLYDSSSSIYAWDIDSNLLNDGNIIITYKKIDGTTPGLKYKIVNKDYALITDKTIMKNIKFRPTTNNHELKTKVLPVGKNGALLLNGDEFGKLSIFTIESNGECKYFVLPDANYKYYNADIVDDNTIILTYQKDEDVYYRKIEIELSESKENISNIIVGEENSIGPCADESRIKVLSLNDNCGFAIYNAPEGIVMGKIKY